MKPSLAFLPTVLASLLAVPFGRADDRYDQDELRRYREAMAKVIKGTPVRSDCYAAIAYSPATGKYGYSYDWPSLAGARREAVARCKASDAVSVGWVKNGYCALARGKDGSYATGFGPTLAQAKAMALRGCRKYTSNCSITQCVFSGR